MLVLGGDAHCVLIRASGVGLPEAKSAKDAKDAKEEKIKQESRIINKDLRFSFDLYF